MALFHRPLLDVDAVPVDTRPTAEFGLRFRMALARCPESLVRVLRIVDANTPASLASLPELDGGLDGAWAELVSAGALETDRSAFASLVAECRSECERCTSHVAQLPPAALWLAGEALQSPAAAGPADPAAPIRTPPPSSAAAMACVAPLPALRSFRKRQRLMDRNAADSDIDLDSAKRTRWVLELADMLRDSPTPKGAWLATD